MTTKQPSDVMTALGTVNDRVSALAAAIKELVISECLTTTTLVISPAGFAEFDWSAGFASVALTNLSADPVTITTSTPADAAPLTGNGVARVLANSGAVHNLASHSLTIYGTPGDAVTVSVFSRPQPPAWG